MQTALLITDCSIDSALALRKKLGSSAQPVRLTVVHPYDLEPGEPLNKITLKEVREAALARLTNWKAVLGDINGGSINTEILFANPELALRMHLLIRQYDAVFTDNEHLATPQPVPDQA